jgi:hypothetical protein
MTTIESQLKTGRPLANRADNAAEKYGVTSISLLGRRSDER